MAIVQDKTIEALQKYNFQLPPKYLNSNLGEIVLEQIDKNSKRNSNVALIDARQPKSKILSKDLQYLVNNLAKTLKTKGLKKGQVAHMLMHNNVDYFVPVLATWVCGGIVSVLNPNSRVEALAEQFKLAGAKIIFCQPNMVQPLIKVMKILEQSITLIILEQIDPECHWKSKSGCVIPHQMFRNDSLDIADFEGVSDYDCMSWQECFNHDLDFDPNERNFAKDDTVLIFWSSGTTGDPKGAMISFDMQARMVLHERSVFVNDIDLRVFLMTTNFFHAGGFTFALINGIKSCNTIIIFSSKDENSVVTASDLHLACHEFKPSVLKLGSHHAIELGYNHPKELMDLSSVKYILPMGAPVYKTLSQELRQHFPQFQDLLINYGSTEMFLVAKTTVPGDLGYPLPGVQYRIRDVETHELLGPNQVGEIMTKTPYLMKGYLKAEQNENFWSVDGFVHTGDLGYYMPDGNLVFQSRLKDLIKFQGNHLYPMELENIIQKHPGVSEVAVFGRPEPKVQELVTALVIKSDVNLEAETIEKLVMDAGVEDYKHLRGGVKFCQELPKNATGKLMRRHLVALYNSL